ncbi:hypothetical protein CMV_021030 [Castanea mollissima]|uniref:Uncharacterized protein n=1 Tax=Castanea mollissima TaxID=60419 RepID=A0A8J4QKK7_9ROSI|nr:hypothetical protein CMV_021030 [Castanea mollissima]
MFNLDKLNEVHPKWLRRDAWDVEQIPEAFDSFVQPMVNKVDRDRLRFEIVNPIFGPSIRRASEVGQHSFTTHHRSDSMIGTGHSQTVSLDTSLNIMSASEPYGLGPGPPSLISINFYPDFLSSMHHNEVFPETNGATKKRFGPNLGRLVRNIRQKLLCGFLQKEGIKRLSLINQATPISQAGPNHTS